MRRYCIIVRCLEFWLRQSIFFPLAKFNPFMGFYDDFIFHSSLDTPLLGSSTAQSSRMSIQCSQARHAPMKSMSLRVRHVGLQMLLYFRDTFWSVKASIRTQYKETFKNASSLALWLMSVPSHLFSCPCFFFIKKFECPESALECQIYDSIMNKE